MNILVTGAGGFVGGYLAGWLAANREDTVFGLIHDRHVTSTLWEPIRGDVTDYARMLEIIVDREIDQVYHLASKAIVRNCRLDPLGCLAANVMGTATVMEAARQSERVQGIMVMESDKVYGDGPLPYQESQALRPGAIYEASKACAAHLLAAYYQNYGLPVFGIRSANIYGPGDIHPSRIVPNTIMRLLRGERPQIVDGAQNFRREYIYVGDACTYAIRLMESKPWGESYNIGSGQVLAVQEMIKLICLLLDKPYDPEILPRPATFKEILSQRLCLDKVNDRLPDMQLTALSEGLKATIDWHRMRML